MVPKIINMNSKIESEIIDFLVHGKPKLNEIAIKYNISEILIQRKYIEIQKNSAKKYKKGNNNMTNKSFEELLKLFNNNKFDEIENDKQGIRFLKLRSISRKDTIVEIAIQNKLNIDSLTANKIFMLVFNSTIITDKIINTYILSKYKIERDERKEDENILINEMYKLEIFNWGGSNGNSLEKNIVNNYIKKIKSYQKINDEIEGALLSSLRGYTLNSWYNHWTSILIEDIFKDHKKILPTVGLIKKIDFFIHDIPFDLKVTYFPEAFMKNKLKEYGYGVEITQIKKICREIEISIPKNLKDDELKNILLKKLKEDQTNEAKEFICTLNNLKKEIISDSMENPNELKVWLYENQGEMRFDASNRFFLILINETNLSESWKLKRNIKFLKEKINYHLNSLDTDLNSLNTDFYWDNDGENYNCKSDILFIKFNENN